MASRDAADVLAHAARPTPAAMAAEVDDHARGLAIVAAIDALEHPDDQRGSFRFARALVLGVDARGLARLASGLPLAQAHGMVEKLALLGAVAPQVAQEAHTRLDQAAVDLERQGKLTGNKSDPARRQPPGS